jgi:hypothetical protein
VGSDVETLKGIMKSYLEGDVGDLDFCGRYERFYNLEADRATFGAREAALLEGLFNEVVLYSPIPADRERYSGYRDERAIRKAALRAWTALELGSD